MPLLLISITSYSFLISVSICPECFRPQCKNRSCEYGHVPASRERLTKSSSCPPRLRRPAVMAAAAAVRAVQSLRRAPLPGRRVERRRLAGPDARLGRRRSVPLLLVRRRRRRAGDGGRAARLAVPEAGAGAAERGGARGRRRLGWGWRDGRRRGGGDAGAGRGRRAPRDASCGGQERRRRRPGQAPRPSRRGRPVLCDSLLLHHESRSLVLH
jgi:hypothetical protein